MHRFVVAVMSALLLAACGGEDVSTEEVDVADPSAACADAFEQAANEEDKNYSRLDDDERTDTSTLLHLDQTLEACQGFDDWMAGARDFPEALPAQLDRTTALRFLCDGTTVEARACEQAETPSQNPLG